MNPKIRQYHSAYSTASTLGRNLPIGLNAKTGLVTLFLLTAILVTPVLSADTFLGRSGSSHAVPSTSSASPDFPEDSMTAPLSPWGERIYIVQHQQSLSEIVHLVTGDRADTSLVAHYNGLLGASVVKAGEVLLIPDPDAIRRQESLNIATVSALSVDQQYLVNDQVNSMTAEPVDDSFFHTIPGKTTSSRLTRANIDMFAGEVRVLGHVDVDRVAVGNGAIVRTEVLANGELLAIAQAAGSTSLHLWHKDGAQSDFNIRVSSHDPEARVRSEKMIRMKVKMVEFRKSALTRLGIDWADSMAGPDFAVAGDLVSNPLFRPVQAAIPQALPTTVNPVSSYFGIATAISSRINFLVSTGDAELLAEPVLSSASGSSAKFLAGGEVPYPSIAPNGQTTVDFKEYGIRLEVAPEVDDEGGVQASILTEISSIDPSVTIQGAPGLLTRRTQTQVNVVAGETIVIAGLLRSDNSKDIDQLPGIARLPVLGKLFRSENIRNNVSELVIFITPEIINPSDRRQHPWSANPHREVDSYSRAKLENVAARLQLRTTD